MSDFNDIIDETLETPSPPLSLYLPPLSLPPPPPPPPPAPSAAPAPSALAPPLGRRSRPSRPPPVASSRDIWDVPSLEGEEQGEGEEDKEDDNNSAPAGGPRYIIEFNIHYLVAIANTII